MQVSKSRVRRNFAPWIRGYKRRRLFCEVLFHAERVEDFFMQTASGRVDDGHDVLVEELLLLYLFSFFFDSSLFLFLVGISENCSHVLAVLSQYDV